MNFHVFRQLTAIDFEQDENSFRTSNSLVVPAGYRGSTHLDRSWTKRIHRAKRLVDTLGRKDTDTEYRERVSIPETY